MTPHHSATRKVVLKKKKNVTFMVNVPDDEEGDVRLAQKFSAEEEVYDTTDALQRQKLKAIVTISLEQQELIDLQQALKLSRQESAFKQFETQEDVDMNFDDDKDLNDDDSEGDDNGNEARQYRVRIRTTKKQTPPIEQHSSFRNSSQDDIYHYLNENPAPTTGTLACR
ncbi:hypothetical protein Tco_0093327 [Tanacetum coccineum]